ncbi:hypothetical protein L211DRAFT_832612 [Terfezia boudieri ATCC MYA-4762]|uniref:Uncharacterized protein n=1 Tax=Terfezia boudieri ATCC MYA-4762 TaxID=1051890 RepID=A0A3N4MCI5_9PEZI|nr:hypothetical protein L211DRAFT_832612 [Terfezia boudieri ATCC MYA-4762]
MDKISLQFEPTVNITELQDVINGEKKCIETLKIKCRRQTFHSFSLIFWAPPEPPLLDIPGIYPP